MKKAEQLIANIQTRKGMGMQDYSHFISPWAQTWEEEVFFETTVETLSNLLRGDMKASLIFQLFLFVSKSEETKNGAALVKKIQVVFLCYLNFSKCPCFRMTFPQCSTDI